MTGWAELDAQLVRLAGPWFPDEECLVTIDCRGGPRITLVTAILDVNVFRILAVGSGRAAVLRTDRARSGVYKEEWVGSHDDLECEKGLFLDAVRVRGSRVRSFVQRGHYRNLCRTVLADRYVPDPVG